MKKKLRFLGISFLIFLFAFSLAGCRKQAPSPKKAPFQIKELTVYAFGDDLATLKPFFEQYQSKNPIIKVANFVTFRDIDEYSDRLINEIANGEGPDIFYFSNFWLAKHWKKVSPMPLELGTAEDFEKTYVDTTSKDLIRMDETGTPRIYGIPMYADNLAIYYNKAHFEDRIPERGRPAIMWEDFKNDVFQLTKIDQSFERFEVAGAALGRPDNIRYAADILYLLMLQLKTKFYNENFSQAFFAHQQGITSGGKSLFPGVEALKFYTSFALSDQKNYSWNSYIADPASTQKELTAFAKGKVSMIFGYSSTYGEIEKEIDRLKQEKVTPIDIANVRVAPVPQFFDPATSTEKRVTFARYYALSVSRNSKYPKEAWDLATFLGSKEVVQEYNKKTNKPVSRRDLIEGTSKDPLYGVFAQQVGFAETPVLYDEGKYEVIFKKAIQDVLDMVDPGQVLRAAEGKVTRLLPSEGLLPKITAPVDEK